ncbi:hypothetical protein PRIPAC_76897 [Pristionchus pacificus]|uniref:Uncharacterized protein n=1 Tax=Pristionchus pacificus TaxID=54126 RepID=A0A2A6CAR2_PRIPA|nr:hypothetical protein PRIPAC_76897 [Pristionchus pacificus]|eukprot:PDM75219.1 hypothetical protein PRIPAC_43413 [Pristionchus pacificus]
MERQWGGREGSTEDRICAKVETSINSRLVIRSCKYFWLRANSEHTIDIESLWDPFRVEGMEEGVGLFLQKGEASHRDPRKCFKQTDLQLNFVFRFVADRADHDTVMNLPQHSSPHPGPLSTAGRFECLQKRFCPRDVDTKYTATGLISHTWNHYGSSSILQGLFSTAQSLVKHVCGEDYLYLYKVDIHSLLPVFTLVGDYDNSLIYPGSLLKECGGDEVDHTANENDSHGEGEIDETKFNSMESDEETRRRRNEKNNVTERGFDEVPLDPSV